MNDLAHSRRTRPERGSRAHTAWADSPPARPAPKAAAQQARHNLSSAILLALVLVLVGAVARCAVLS